MTSSPSEGNNTDPARLVPRGRMVALTPLLLFLFLVGVYNINRDYFFINDVVPNLFLPVQILNEGALTFTADSHPFMFKWKSTKGGKEQDCEINSWNASLRREYAEGTLKLVKCKYYIVKGVVPILPLLCGVL